MPTAVVTVDCEAGHENRRCFAGEIVKVAEEFHIPITWLIYVSGKDPMNTVLLYHQEYLHRIPSWHEIGLHLHFEDDHGYVEDSKRRGDLIRLGKDVLKTCHVKPTAFRAGCQALLPSDVQALEDIGIVVDSSVAPDAEYRMFVDWAGAPTQPYHPRRDDLRQTGDSKLLIAPVATHEGKMGYLSNGYVSAKPLLEHHAANSDVFVLAAYDYVDCADTLRETLTMLKAKRTRFVTMTALAAERG